MLHVSWVNLVRLVSFDIILIEYGVIWTPPTLKPWLRSCVTIVVIVAPGDSGHKPNSLLNFAQHK
jgi:hypothetical protein